MVDSHDSPLTPTPAAPHRRCRLRFWLRLVSLLTAAIVWLGAVHYFFRPRLDDFRRSEGIAPQARLLAARHLQLWENPQRRAVEIERMRRSNAEWDFMGRTFPERVFAVKSSWYGIFT